MEIADINGDGALTREEFEREAKILLHKDEHLLTEQSFALLDYDSNGELDWSERASLGMSYRDQAKDDPMKLVASDIVSQFDTDGDFQISREEFGTLARYTAALFSLNAADLERKFEDLAGEDGLISRAEVQEGLRASLQDT